MKMTLSGICKEGQLWPAFRIEPQMLKNLPASKVESIRLCLSMSKHERHMGCDYNANTLPTPKIMVYSLDVRKN